jgi:hypothetical protein
MGQPKNPLHPDGLLAPFKGPEGARVHPTEIDRMAKENPARLLALE